ncbi:MAG: GatB/YqeY domain-containing protein [Armatimonadota bacterium]|nr:GatB/YqeY domain-containing protein [Armatimonadota bacterium]MDR7450440.1 GatB/YqeY domain-containing protein [Armatimonadota bacterium]MDR7466977.1 GatB/YqeY domain-containing protein [Armatimonadota bacterium]MDR7493481.1 GatB/YqeY domain-containing protein [Armatimonadota bacterium]MDR7498746.1 GatB/YqeY domain-containing protein [Armatimonadota bacterium]
MSLADRLKEDLNRALRAGDSLRVSTIRLARAAIHNAAIERGRDLTDLEIQDILAREMKRRREAIEAYTRAGREDLVQKETLELAILTEYLPPLDEAQLRAMIRDTVAQVGATGPQDLGRVMGALMPRLRGRADGGLVQRLVREALGA